MSVCTRPKQRLVLLVNCTQHDKLISAWAGLPEQCAGVSSADSYPMVPMQPANLKEVVSSIVSAPLDALAGPLKEFSWAYDKVSPAWGACRGCSSFSDTAAAAAGGRLPLGAGAQPL